MNRRLEPVTYKRFRFDGSEDGQGADSLLSVQRGDGGALEAKVAMGLARLADEQFEKAAGIAARRGAEASSAQARANAPRPVTVTQKDGGGYRVYTGSGIEQAKALLRDEEGFRPAPYWDVNAHRAGYGSDTVTLADGRSVKVTQGMTISRADAERDLEYRLSAREGAQVRRQLGAAFDQLPASAQAALYSVGYNYGSLPDSVVAAGRSGNVGAIADAVAALPANSKRRQREAAMIRGSSGAPATGAASGGEGASASGPVSITPGAAGTWRPSGKDTAYGRAYDIAGTKTYLQELRFTMLQDQDAVYEAYKDDPAMLEKALGELETAHMRDHVFPEIADEYSLDFRKQAYTRVQQAREDFNTRQKARDRNDFLDRVGTLEERKAQAFARAGMGDVGANMVLSSLQNDIDSHIDSAVARGIYTPEEAKRAAKESRDGLLAGVYTAQSANKRPEEIAAMRQELYERWSRGEEPDIDAGTMAKINRDLEAAEDRRRAQDKVADTALRTRGNDLVERTMRGLPVDPSEASRFQLDVGTAPNGEEIGRSTNRRLLIAEAIRTRPIADVEKNLWSILSAGGSVTPEDYDFAVKAVDAHKAEVIKDPLGVAERFGVVPTLGPLPDPASSSPDDLAAALTARMAYADVAGEYFGVPAKYFRPEEEEAIKRSLISTDVQRHGSAMQQLDVVAGKLGLLEVERQFGADAVGRLQDWQSRVRYATPAEAQQWLKERNDPKWQERVRPLVTKGEGEARKSNFDDVARMLDDSWFRGAGAPVDSATRQAMMNDFVQLTGERYATTNDVEQAKEQAIERMRKVWGGSSVTGDKRLMLYPPEQFYPSIAGSQDWIGEELKGVASEHGFDVSSMALVSDGKTKAAIERGEAPGYLMTRVDPDTGLEELVSDDKGRPLRHFFDPAAAREEAANMAKNDRQAWEREMAKPRGFRKSFRGSPTSSSSSPSEFDDIARQNMERLDQEYIEAPGVILDALGTSAKPVRTRGQ
ncbi:hypothetical protein ACO34A_13100 [Rhizobium sp. ACO-34A]|nr:hypothetical protein [Rhizobium sp. ACO-34A]ATN34737.1 hypothetical protein ACO34A_13100 [Rhizobium sp. ACO-34A]